MLSAENCETITGHLSRNGICPDDLISASGYYLLGLYSLQNIEDCLSFQNIVRSLTSPKCDSFFKNFGLTSLDTDDVLSSHSSQNLFLFCEALVELGLDNDPYAFYDYLWPYLVCDGGTISKYCSDDPFTIACALHIAITANLQKYDIPSNTVESYFIYSQYEKAFQMIALTDDDFSYIWDACFFTELAEPYQNWKRPAFTDLFHILPKALSPDQIQSVLSDYEKVYFDAKLKANSSFKKHLANALSDPHYEGHSEEYIKSLVGLRLERPSDVIHCFQYRTKGYQTHDDFSIETSLLIHELYSFGWNAQNILIVNPTPAFVYSYSRSACAQYSTTFLVQSNACTLLEAQFPSFHFINNSACLAQFDRVVFLAHDISPEKLDLCCHQFHPNAHILAYLPQTYFTSKTFIHDLSTKSIHISRIVSIPSNIPDTSKPKKKALVYAQVRQLATPAQVQLFTLQVHSNLLEIPKNAIAFGEEELNQCRTLIQLHNDLNASMDAPKKAKSSVRMHQFSKEIAVHYTFFKDRYNSCSAQAYFRAILRPEQKQRKQGDRLTQPTEKGLRAKTEAEVLERLEQFPLREENYSLVAEDVLDAYQSRTDQLSLKTIWFCCLNALQTTLNYNHEIAVKLFCSSDSKAISDLIPAKCNENDFLALIDPDSKKLWIQLNLILSIAKQNHLISFNPIKNAAPIIRLKVTSELQALRSALSRSSFTWAEERKVVTYLCQPDSASGLPLCVADSHYLAVAIRLFTGLNVREIGALQWKHFVDVPELGYCQLLVMQHLNNNDQPISNASYASQKAHRKFPCPAFLSTLLQSRRQYILSSTRYSAEEILDHPIILSAEYPAKKGKSYIPDYCRRRTINSVSKSVLAIAAIPKNIVTLMEHDSEFDIDINAYLGDIFNSNFRSRAVQIGFLTEGELCYIVGIKASRTFDNHYADYSHPLSQQMISQALNSWASLYYSCISLSIPSQGISVDWSANCPAAITPQTFVTIPKQPDDYMVTLICDHDLKGNVCTTADEVISNE